MLQIIGAGVKAFYENKNYSDNISICATPVDNLHYGAHWHSDTEMLYVSEGQIGVGINNNYRILKKGDISICGSNDIHYYNSDGMESKGIMIFYRPAMLNTIKDWTKIVNPCSIFITRSFNAEDMMPDNIYLKIYRIFESILDETYTKDELYFQFTKLKISEMFLLLLRYYPFYYDNSVNMTSMLSSTNIGPMQKALKYIEDNYNKEISLDIISEHVGLSVYYLSRIFKNTTGTNFKSYLTHTRINKAEELIVSTKKYIINIAYETGFPSVRTFNRSFKSLKGYTPKSLRDDDII